MAEGSNKKLLNLAGELSSRVSMFFVQHGVEIVLPEVLNNIKEINYILVKDWVDFDELNNRYQVVENNITVISLSHVEDNKDFLLANGRVVLDETWLDNKVGQIMLSKMFQDAGSIHLDEIFGQEFKEYKSCKVSSHLRLGHYSDLISMDAFDNDYNIVAIRGFLYHVIYYFTYLKQAGLGGIPFEVEYASNSSNFVVHCHMNVKNFVAEYLLDCFGDDNTTDPLKYLLNTAHRLADNMDVTYIENPSKLIITGIWRKLSEERVYKYNQLHLNNIKTSKQILDEVERSLATMQTIDANPETDNRQETLKDKPLPGNLVEMVINPADPESIMNKKPKEAANVMAFVVATLEEQGKKPEDVTEEELSSILEQYTDTDFTQEMTDNDKRNLMDKLQKKNITDAYEKEVQRVKGELDEDEDHLVKVEENFSEGMAERVVKALDADSLNQFIQDNPVEEDENKQVVTGRFDLDTAAFNVQDGGLTEDGDKITVHDGGLTEDGDKITVHDGGLTEDGDKITVHDGGITEDEDKITVHGDGVTEEEDKITVHGGVTEDEDKITVHGGETEEDEDEVRVKGVTDITKEEEIRVEGGEAEEEEEAITVGGETEDIGEEAMVAEGSGEGNLDDKFGARISGGEDDDQSMVGRLSGMPAEEEREGFRVSGVTDEVGDGSAIGRLSGGDKDNISRKLDRAFQQVTRKMREEGGTLDFGSMMNDMRQSLIDQGIDPELAEQVIKSTQHFANATMSQDMQDQNGNMDELTANYLNDFKKKKFHSVVDEALDKVIVREPEEMGENALDMSALFKKKFSKNLQNNLSDIITDEDGNPRPLTQDDFMRDDVQQAIQQSVQSVFQEELHVIAGNDKDKFEQLEEQAIKSLTDVLPLDEEMLRQMAEQSSDMARGFEVGSVVDNIFSGAPDSPIVVEDQGLDEEAPGDMTITAPNQSMQTAALMEKIKKFEFENEKLQAELKKNKIDSSAKDQTIKQLQTMTRDAKMAAVKLQKDMPQRQQLMTEDKRKNLQDQINNNDNLSQADKELLNKTLDREKRLLDITKKAELEFRKIQIEARQKESKFELELQKQNRMLAAKDTVISKAKDQLEAVVKRKDIELRKLNERINEINKKHALNDNDKVKNDLKKMEKENQNLQRMVDVYKRKATGMEAEVPAAGPGAGADAFQEVAKVKDQVKHLESVKQKLEQKLVNFERNANSMSAKVKEQATEINKIEKEKKKLMADLKQAKIQADSIPEQVITGAPTSSPSSPDDAPPGGLSQREKMVLQGKVQEAEKNVKDLTGKLKIMEKKVDEGQAAIRQAKQLTAKESALKKDLFAANKKLQTMQEKLVQVERKADFSSTDTIGNKVLDEAKVEVDKVNNKNKELEQRLKKAEKELQQALLGQFKDAKKGEKGGDPVAALKAHEAKLKLQLMDSKKKEQFNEAKIKELEKQLAESKVSTGQLPDTGNLKDKENLHKALENESKLKESLGEANKKIKSYQEKIKKAEKDLQEVLLAQKKVGSGDGLDIEAEKDNANAIIEQKLREQLESSNKRVKDSENQLKTLERRLKQTEDELRKTKGAPGASGPDSSQIENKLKSDLLSQQRKVSELTQKNKVMEKKLQQAEMAKSKAQEDMRRLANENAKNQAASSGISSDEATKMKTELATAQRKIASYDTQMKQLDKLAKDAAMKIDSAQAQAKAANKQATAMEARYKQESLQNKRQAQDYQNKIKDLEKRVKELGGSQANDKGQQSQQVNLTKFKQLEANNKKLMQELGKAKNMTASSKQELAKLNAVNTGLQNKVKQMEKELAKAQIALRNVKKGGGRAA
jgi:hypothetical protein